MSAIKTISLTLLVGLAPMIWGSTYFVTTEFLPADRPLIAATIRCLPAGLLLVLLSLYLPRGQQWFKLAILSVLNFSLFQALLFVAAYQLPGGLAAVLGAIQPLVVMVLVWIVNAQAPKWLTVGASITAIFGMAMLLLSPQTQWNVLGVSAALLGAISMSLGTFLAHRWHSEIPTMAFTGWQLLLGGLFLLPIALLSEPQLPDLNQTHFLAYGYIALFGTLISYLLWFKGIAWLPSVSLSSLSLLSPVSAIIIGWLLLGQSLSLTAGFGMAIVLTSTLLIQFTSTAQASTKPTIKPAIKQANSAI